MLQPFILKDFSILEEVYGREKSNRSSSPSTLTSSTQAVTMTSTVDLFTSSMTSDCVSTMCAKLYGAKFKGRSCSKIILVDLYYTYFPESTVRMYAILNDQSNCSLASPE